jgi:hypothetical protein
MHALHSAYRASGAIAARRSTNLWAGSGWSAAARGPPWSAATRRWPTGSGVRRAGHPSSSCPATRTWRRPTGSARALPELRRRGRWLRPTLGVRAGFTLLRLPGGRPPPPAPGPASPGAGPQPGPWPRWRPSGRRSACAWQPGAATITHPATTAPASVA